MKTVMITVGLFLMALPTFGQQSTTDTDCTVNDQRINCTSKTKTEPPPPEDFFTEFKRHQAEKRARAEANRDPQAEQAKLSQEAMKERLAEEKKEREAKDTVDFIYCRQNPKGGITETEGKLKTCADIIDYTKAFCSVNPEVERCTLAKSKPEVEKAFAALVDEYNTNAKRNKKWEQAYFGEKFAKLTKWGCMSFPDMVLPQRDGGMHPCPNAPEAATVHERRTAD
jgi:sarcosine oxidase delta subunit